MQHDTFSTLPPRLPPVFKLTEAITVLAKERKLRRAVAALERDMAKAFTVQGRKLLASSRVLESSSGAPLHEAWTVYDWLRLFDAASAETVELFVNPLQAGISTSLVLGADVAIAELAADFAFNLQNPRAVAYLESRGYGLISQIDEVTRGNIATIVDAGVTEGWSYNRIAKEISSLYSEMAIGKPQLHIDSRAHLIAITEAGNAYEAGNIIVAEGLAGAGLEMQKSWLTVGDDRVSAGCQENHDAGWIALEQDFPSGHARPLRFPGCRCTALYRRRAD